MNKGRAFRIQSWVHPHTSEGDFLLASRTVSKMRVPEEKKCHSIKNFFVPDWAGDNLPSNDFVDIVRSAQSLFCDAKMQYTRTTMLPRLPQSLKKAIYDEFIRYAGTENIEAIDFHDFWSSMADENSPLQEVLEKFKNLYCFRLVMVYIYKMKFILTLTESINFPLSENLLLSPNSLLSKIFRKGSSTELNCYSLGVNSYSWYRPSSRCTKIVRFLKKKLTRTTACEMIKVCNYDHFTLQEKQNISLCESKEYSHSLSHKSFGLFINNLLSDYPRWLLSGNNSCQKKEILKTKFVGASMHSIFMSHWLARGESIDKQVQDIFLPTFFGENVNNILYTNVCSELQFLTLLAKTSQIQNINAVKFICNALKQESPASKMSLMDQMYLPLESDDNAQGLLYTRILLHLPEIVKRNPHYHLITKINHHIKALDENGFMFVLTNQKLFVPSQAERTELFLKDVKVHTFFNFEGLEGKGEIPDFLYIFSKKQHKTASAFLPSMTIGNNKESLLTFNIFGKIFLFKNFRKIVDELKAFLKEKTPYATPVHRSEINQSLTLEYHQDAIIGGKILSSTNRNNDNITHPNFFKRLTKSCTTFDKFFLVEHLKHKDRFDLTGDLLGLHYTYQDKYLYVLIVDFSCSTKVSIEIIPSEAYNARLEKYGTACFQYYGLLTKIPDININIFREYFNTEIGSQIVQLSLNGPIANLKSKINALLIPKFFSHTNFPSKMDQRGLSFLEYSCSTLLNKHPKTINQDFAAVEQYLEPLAIKYPWYILGISIHFKNNCLQAVDMVDGKSMVDGVNYSNPLIIDKITELQTYSLFDNPDIYIEFHIKDKEELSLPLQACSSQKNETGWGLELKSGTEEKTICTFYAEAELIHFLVYILEEARSEKTKISSILQRLQIPKTEDLKQALSAYKSLKSCFENLYKNSQNMISDIFRRQIV